MAGIVGRKLRGQVDRIVADAGLRSIELLQPRIPFCWNEPDFEFEVKIPVQVAEGLPAGEVGPRAKTGAISLSAAQESSSDQRPHWIRWLAPIT